MTTSAEKYEVLQIHDMHILARSVDVRSCNSAGPRTEECVKNHCDSLRG